MQFPEFEFDWKSMQHPRPIAGSVALTIQEYMKAVESMSKLSFHFFPVAALVTGLSSNDCSRLCETIRREGR